MFVNVRSVSTIRLFEFGICFEKCIDAIIVLFGIWNFKFEKFKTMMLINN